MTILFPIAAILFFSGITVFGVRAAGCRRQGAARGVIGGLFLGGWLTLWWPAGYCRLGAAILLCWLVPLGLAYGAGWRLPARRWRGWRLHLARGVICAVILGPLAAVRYAEMYTVPRWLLILGDVTGAEWRHFFLYGLPGFALAGLLTAILSAYCHGDVRRHSRRFGMAAGLLLLPLVNWYAAGMIDVYDCARFDRYRRLTYVLASRPGTRTAGDFFGATLVHHARSPEMIHFLHRRGIEIDGRIRRGWQSGRTPLHLAAEAGRIDLMAALMQCGANVNELDAERWTPLHRAVHAERVPAMKMLIGSGANVEAVDCGGNTALHWAVVQGCADGVATLLTAGARLDVINAKGLKPADLMTKRTPADVRQQLMKKAARR